MLADAAQVESPGDRRAFLGAPARLAPPLWNAFVGALAAICAHNAFDCAEPSWSGQPQCFLRTPLSPFEDLSADRLWWD
ncbi:MAG: hypothetical protein LBO20_03995 [Bifidobacteriaceae bacterium]|nr:hypothetical protein [Bifidobacteriaceae bacterium]